MNCCGRIGLVFLGLLVAACGCALLPSCALAQSRIDTSIVPPPTRKPFAAKSRRALPPPADETFEAETPPPGPADRDAEDEEEDGQQASGTRGEHASTLGNEDAGLKGEIAEPVDGVIVVGEPTPLLDGIPDLHKDPRTRQDIAAFEFPRQYYDPYLFQIEPEPLLDRRPWELFRVEPYDPQGVRAAGFVIFPEAEIGAVATNNIFRTNVRTGDHALEAAGNLRAISDWRTHAVEFRAGGIISYYDAFTTENDRSYWLESRGRLDITRQTNIEILAGHRLDKDSRSARDAPSAAAERGDVETNRLAMAVNHRFNRLSLQLRGVIVDYDYAPVPSLGGGIITNNERDTIQREVAFRTTWQFNGNLGAFAETAFNTREFDTPPADGMLRSSDGERYRVGLAFGPWGATIRGEVSAGWGRQEPKDGRLAPIEGLLIDANLAWRATALTSFLLTVRTEFVDTTASGSGGAFAKLAGIEMRHAFRRHLIGTAGVRLTSTPYDGIFLNERELTGELGLEYYLGPDTMLFSRYQHVAFDSTVPGADYSAEVVRVGIRFRH